MCQKNSPKMEPIKPHVSAPRRALTGVSHSDFLPQAKSTESQERLEQKAHPSRAGAAGRGPKGCEEPCVPSPHRSALGTVRAPHSACRAPNPRGAHTARGESGIPNGGMRGPRAALLPRVRNPAWGASAAALQAVGRRKRCKEDGQSGCGRSNEGNPPPSEPPWRPKQGAGRTGHPAHSPWRRGQSCALRKPAETPKPHCWNQQRPPSQAEGRAAQCRPGCDIALGTAGTEPPAPRDATLPPSTHTAKRSRQ